MKTPVTKEEQGQAWIIKPLGNGQFGLFKGIQATNPSARYKSLANAKKGYMKRVYS